MASLANHSICQKILMLMFLSRANVCLLRIGVVWEIYNTKDGWQVIGLTHYKTTKNTHQSPSQITNPLFLRFSFRVPVSMPRIAILISFNGMSKHFKTISTHDRLLNSPSVSWWNRNQTKWRTRTDRRTPWYQEDKVGKRPLSTSAALSILYWFRKQKPQRIVALV